MNRFVAAGITLAFASNGVAQAQNTYQWPAPDSVQQGDQRFYLPMGTELMLRTRSQISTKENKPGDRVYLEVAEAVSFRGQAVIPSGSPVVAEVSQAQRNGHFGRKGKLLIRLLYAQTPSGPVRLSGSTYDEGTSGTIASVGTILFVSTLGFLIHGTSANIMPDTPVRAQLAEPLKFTYNPAAAAQRADAVQAQPDQAAALLPGTEGYGARVNGAPSRR